MIESEQLICDHKNRNLEKRVSDKPKRDLEILDQFEPKSGCSLVPTSSSNKEVYTARTSRLVCLHIWHLAEMTGKLSWDAGEAVSYSLHVI